MNTFEIIATIAVVVQAIYAAATFHRDGPREMESDPAKRPKRPLIIVALLMLTTWAAVGFDYYDRHTIMASAMIVPDHWGVGSAFPGAPPVYGVQIGTALIQQYKNSFKAVLIARNMSVPNVDPLNDTAIEKSVGYTIDGPTLSMTFEGTGKIKFGVGQPNEVQLIVALLPNEITPEQILKIGDIKRLGGKIISSAAQMVVGAAPISPPATPTSP